MTLDCVFPIDTRRSRPRDTVDSTGENTEDPRDLREFREVPDDQRAPSPVIPEPRSRPVTLETPEQQRRMTEGPYLLTTEMLQTLLAACDRPLQTSYPKLQEPEPFELEKSKIKTFLAQCELKFITEGNRFDDDEKKTRYTSSLLREVAWNWVETFLNQERGINLSWKELKTNMRHAFGQVDVEEIAFEKFQILIQQGYRMVATYWAEFQRIKADLPYMDNVCIARFQDRLHPEVKRHLVMSEAPATVLVDYACYTGMSQVGMYSGTYQREGRILREVRTRRRYVPVASYFLGGP